MAATARLDVGPIDTGLVLKDKIYDALKQAMAARNAYAEAGELRLDERQLCADLGVSRTPVREALARLEQEGFVRTVPRRGDYVVRKTKTEILDMIVVWAALESMAARLVTERASDAEIASLRRMFATFDDGQVRARIDEYSDTNARFHQALQEAGATRPFTGRLEPWSYPPLRDTETAAAEIRRRLAARGGA